MPAFTLVGFSYVIPRSNYNSSGILTLTFDAPPITPCCRKTQLKYIRRSAKERFSLVCLTSRCRRPFSSLADPQTATASAYIHHLTHPLLYRAVLCRQPRPPLLRYCSFPVAAAYWCCCRRSLCILYFVTCQPHRLNSNTSSSQQYYY